MTRDDGFIINIIADRFANKKSTIFQPSETFSRIQEHNSLLRAHRMSRLFTMAFFNRRLRWSTSNSQISSTSLRNTYIIAQHVTNFSISI